MSHSEAVINRVVSRLPGYERRPQQLEMARAVETAIATGRHAIIEAGTGSGKSFGYLVPILESGQKAVIATGTIALQEQLLRKDLPFLQEALGRPVKVALAKGRGNYICLRKLHELDQSLGVSDPDRPVISDLIALSGSRKWLGDRADLPFVVENRVWMDSLASDGEDCLGPRCQNFVLTPHRLARLACEAADVIVANHALYFTDLVMRTGVLPEHKIAVFDEAHHLERAALNALTVSVNRWSMLKMLQRAQRRLPSMSPSLLAAVREAEEAVLNAVFERGRGQHRIQKEPALEAAAARLSLALGEVGEWISHVPTAQMKMLDTDGPQAQTRAEMQREQMASVAEMLAGRWDYFARPEEEGERMERARWMRVDPLRDFFELHSAPLDAGENLREILWNKRTCVLTSATLAVDGGFDFLKRELGIEKASEHVLGSPFRFQEQALLYVPADMPPPNSPGFTEALVPRIEQILRLSGGRAFVLFTSYRALREVAGMLAGQLPFPCKTQEDLPRAALVDWFRTTPRSVLFATATFWEGVDIPGEALSCVIIDKIPFASPDEPLVQARTERMKAAGEDWFSGFMLPKAIMALKQGFGRLIRTATDTGIIAILDHRLLSKQYGATILRSLPPARRTTRLPASLEAVFGRTTTDDRRQTTDDGRRTTDDGPIRTPDTECRTTFLKGHPAPDAEPRKPPSRS